MPSQIDNLRGQFTVVTEQICLRKYITKQREKSTTYFQREEVVVINNYLCGPLYPYNNNKKARKYIKFTITFYELSYFEIVI